MGGPLFSKKPYHIPARSAIILRYRILRDATRRETLPGSGMGHR